MHLVPNSRQPSLPCPLLVLLDLLQATWFSPLWLPAPLALLARRAGPEVMNSWEGGEKGREPQGECSGHTESASTSVFWFGRSSVLQIHSRGVHCDHVCGSKRRTLQRYPASMLDICFAYKGCSCAPGYFETLPQPLGSDLKPMRIQ